MANLSAAMAYDILVRGGSVVDGTGSSPRTADIGIQGGRIVRVGECAGARADRTIDARGLFVAPGFIDIHTHSDIGILVEPTAECAVRQGVTTHVIGNCGDSPAPISEGYRELATRRFEYYAQAREWDWTTYGEYLDFMGANGVGVNIAGLVGHGAIRTAVMGFDERAPNREELRSMKAHVEEAMAAGAFGMSTGLVYPPGCFAATEETDELVDLLQDAMKRKQLREEVRADRTPGAGYVGLLVHDRFDRIWLLRCPHDPAKEGLTIAELAARRGVDPWTAYFDVIVEEQDRAVGLFDYMDLGEIKSTLRHPLVMICSVGRVSPKDERTSATARYQPCTFGEFPGVLQRFVVEEPVLTLPNAIHKMTGMPARRLAFKDRGLIREGFAADLVVFDLPRVKDRATNRWPHAYPFENYPHEYPEGIDW